VHPANKRNQGSHKGTKALRHKIGTLRALGSGDCPTTALAWIV